ncbi:MAG: hypothetical protein V4739_07320 [Pseudomonadota bacterium]
MATDGNVTITKTFINAQLPVFICDLSPLQDALDQASQAVKELQLSHPASTPSNVKAVYMSPWKSHTLNAKLTPLCTAVTNLARLGAQGISGSDLAALNMSMAVMDCWGAVYQSGDSALRHNHFPADFAAVVYLEAEAGCAPLILSGHAPVQPRPGMLLLFPGILDHEVPANDGRRVVVAMNLYKKTTFAPSA